MKKLFFILLATLFIAGLFAALPRSYTQLLVTDQGEQLPGVENTSSATDEDYLLTAYVTARPTEVTSTATHAASLIRVFRFGNGTSVPYVTCAFFQFSTFATNWTAGETIHFTITHLPTMQVATWDLEIPTGTQAIGYRQTVNPIPQVVCPPATVVADTWTYNLTLNGPVGTQVTGPDAVVHTLPVVLTDNDDDINELIGLYTAAAAPEGFHWAVNPIEVVAGDFTAAKTDYVYNATKTFELVANPDTYNYTLNVNGPAGYAVAGPVAGMLPYMATDDMVGDLVGMYTVAEAPAGWHWAVNPIEVTADMFQLVTKGAGLGSRNTGAKLHYEYAATITFELVENPPVYDYPEGTPVVVVIGTVTVTGGNGNDVPAGSVPPIPNGAFVPEFQTVMQLLGAGPWTISFGTTQPWGAWYSYTSAAWMVVPNVGGMITFVIPAGGKDIPQVPMVFGPVDPTLPVELSSFNAVLTAENFVKLTWTSESETNMLGYRVYRAEADDYAAATLITPVMIEATNSSTHQAYSITDNEVSINTTYYYWLEAVDMSHSVLYGPNQILVTGNVTPNIPTVTTLGNAYPNPFRNQTSIALEVKENETATVTIYNILGQVVKTYNKGQGTHTINWDGKDARGNACGSGIYFYRLTSPSMNQTKKMVIVK
jgi:hypothetical protein